MEIFRPGNTEPIPGRRAVPRVATVGTIMLRLVGLLATVVALLVWAWSR